MAWRLDRHPLLAGRLRGGGEFLFQVMLVTLQAPAILVYGRHLGGQLGV